MRMSVGEGLFWRACQFLNELAHLIAVDFIAAEHVGSRVDCDQSRLKAFDFDLVPRPVQLSFV
jgi:hypothetical protein